MMNSRRDHMVLGGILLSLAALALVRTLVLGWDDLAPDDARYLYVGLSVLDGHGAVTPAGNPYLLRSPVYGVILALGARLLGDDVITGAHVAASAIGLAGLFGATAVAGRLGGSIAAVATGLALVAMPLPWALLPTLRVDQALAAIVVGLVFVASVARPGIWRAATAGAILGVGVLVKEAVLPVVVLPVAWLSPGWHRPWLRRAAAFVLMVILVAGWWWLVVWVEGEVLFPLNALGVIDARQVSTAGRLGRLDIAIAAAGAAAWAIVTAMAVRVPHLRPLVVAAVALLPAAGYAFVSGLAERNYLPLALLTGVAIGLAAAAMVAWMRARSPNLPPQARRWLVVAGATVVLIVIVMGQVAAPRASPSRLPALVAAEIRQRTEPAQAVVMPFRDRETVGLELYGRNSLRSLGAGRVTAAARPADYVWMGLRDRQLFGITRSAWQATVGGPDVTMLVIVVPHPLSPATLIPSLEGPGPRG